MLCSYCNKNFPSEMSVCCHCGTIIAKIWGELARRRMAAQLDNTLFKAFAGCKKQYKRPIFQ